MNEPVRQDELSHPTPSPDDQLHILIENPSPDVAVARVTGDLDLVTVDVLRERLRPRIGPPNRTLVLDLTGVGFLGSAGLAELAEASATAKRIGLRFALVASGRAVLQPLEVTGLHAIFQVFGSVEAALREV